MLNRFKNKLVNIVGGISNPQLKENGSPSSPTLPQDVSPFPYARPAFLQLSTDEVQVSADHISRPILVPRNGSRLPWNAGYAEVINAGKSKVNEDQARSEVLLLPKQKRPSSTEDNGEMTEADRRKQELEDAIPVHYFAVFDGHAGTGAGLMAVNILHLIIQDKLMEVQHLIEAQLTGILSTLSPTSPTSPRPPQSPQSPQSPMTPPFSPPPDPSHYDNHPLTPHDKTAENSQLPEGAAEVDPDDVPLEAKHDDVSSSSEEHNIHSINDPVTAGDQDADHVEPNLSNDINQNEDVPDGAKAVDSNDESSLVDNGSSVSDSPATSGINRAISMDIPQPRHSMSLTFDKFNIESMIEGALEASFFDMDGVISRERRVYRVPGGCTAVVAFFFLGKLYVANAGDSRAMLSINGRVVPMSYDFTPETDRQRIQMMAWHHPELLCDLFCPIQFAHRIGKKDIGKRVLHRDGWRKSWSYKTVHEDDVRMPLIYGEGKKARLLGTIGVSRGFGDHDLRVYESDVFVKPFMTCTPEVMTFDLGQETLTENDVLIMGTDGLWDVTSNEKAADIVTSSLKQFSPDDPSRYVSAAQELVMYARGILQKGGGWRTTEERMASGDDITVFVIPVNKHNQSISPSNSTESTN